ncbi:MAG: questin oxidase family protein [Proteobacteria bacterium]|nr:questin oxidase family protein [Pseudomonadota bacterium]
MTTDRAIDLYADLDAAARFAPSFDNGLSSHLAMTLHAQHRLGASAGQRAAFLAAYTPQLTRRDAAWADGPLANWPAHLGQRHAFEPLRAHFAHAIGVQGLPTVLAQVLPHLLPGAGGDAFHGLIRLGHALDAGHAPEQAQALAYWACCALPLRPAQAVWPVGTLAAPAWLAGVLGLPRPVHPDLEKPRIALRMKAWATAQGFDAAATALAVGATPASAVATVDALAAQAARLYAHTANFTVLHVITSLWALRMLLPHTPDPVQAVRTYAVAMAAGLRAARLGAAHADLLRTPVPPPLDWATLRAHACASTDDHAAKFLWACEQWAGVSDDAVYLAAASAQWRGLTAQTAPASGADTWAALPARP